MLQSDEREILIDIRFEKADENLKTARLVFDASPDNAASAAYYCVLHSIQALFLQHGISTTKKRGHRSGIDLFRACSLKNIVKRVKVCQNSCMMEISQVQYERIADCFPVHRGNVAYDNLRVLNAILYVMENGCKWRRLPEKFGNWHTIYMRMSRWYKSGVLDKVFERLQHERLLRMRLEAVCLDSSCVKVHPDGTGALKKGGLNLSASLVEDGPPRFIWLPRVPIVR